MAKKTVTLRITHEAEAFMLKKGSSLSVGAQTTASHLLAIEQYSDREVAEIFSEENEWNFLYDTHNGTMIEDWMRFNATMLCAHCEDCEDIYYIRWNINRKAFSDKCASLTAAQCDAVYRRIEKFWAQAHTEKCSYTVNDTETGNYMLYSGFSLADAVNAILEDGGETWDLYRNDERIYCSQTNTLSELTALIGQ